MSARVPVALVVGEFAAGALEGNVAQSERLGHHADCEWTGKLASQVGATVRLEFGDQPIGLRLDEPGEAVAHPCRTKWVRERFAVSRVGRTVEREHAGAHHS